MKGRKFIIVAAALTLAAVFMFAGCTEQPTRGTSDGTADTVEKTDAGSAEIVETLDPIDHNHTHDWQVVETVEPWFERQGYTRYRCSICGDEKDTDFQDALVAEKIYAVFNQGDLHLTPETGVQAVREKLTVFAVCTNGREVELEDFVLDGALEAKTSVITVQFMDKLTEFTVNVDME